MNGFLFWNRITYTVYTAYTWDIHICMYICTVFSDKQNMLIPVFLNNCKVM